VNNKNYKLVKALLKFKFKTQSYCKDCKTKTIKMVKKCLTPKIGWLKNKWIIRKWCRKYNSLLNL